ncbi:MAG: AAA family ATPase [Thermoflexales bacterium]
MDAKTTEVPFVARTRELEKLERLLGRALQSHMQVVMVTGEPGAGKSTLIDEFAARAEAAHKDLVVAFGLCNSRTGAGDAYLPFRDILVTLTRPPEPEPPSTDPAKPKPKAKDRHTRQILRAGAEAFLDIAPDIIGVFVPGGALLGKFVGKVARSAADKTGALSKIDAEPAAEASRTAPDLSAPALDEGKIQQQYTAFLRAVTARQPLILVLDDLQWADTASINLLFHLVRELKDSQLMIIGAYRENDIAYGRDNTRHPIEPALNEVKRYFGDVWIELDKADAEDRHSLLDALLDVEPNAYSADFRQALYAKTAGHPLFTLELLRDLQERGDLVKDERGKWRPGNDIDWSELPARVEGVVSERVARLEAPLREILNVAAVEGSSFFAQVVGKILNQAERLVLRDMSRELEKRHRLIAEQGEVKAGRAILSRFTFANTMLQQYLYDQLGSGERRLWHGDIGNALEGLLGAKADDFAVELAHHYDLAGDDEKAIGYLAKIGDKAMQVSAFAQARIAFEKALEHMRDADLVAVGALSLETLQYQLAEVSQRTGALDTAVDLLEVCLATRGEDRRHPLV